MHADRIYGRNVVTYELPVTMPFSGISKKDAQTIVYAAIIQNLKKRGFEARISLTSDKTVLYIIWVATISQTELDAMTSIIRNATISPKNADKLTK